MVASPLAFNALGSATASGVQCEGAAKDGKEEEGGAKQELAEMPAALPDSEPEMAPSSVESAVAFDGVQSPSSKLEQPHSHDGAAPAAAAVGAVTTPGLPAAGTQASSAAAASALQFCPQQATIVVQGLASKCRQRFLDGFAAEERRVVERILERQADYEYEIGLSQSSKALAPYDW